MTDLVLRDLRKSFGRQEAIHGVDLEVRSGEFMVFVGPSGCGKSTLLRLIAGLEDITSGDLLFDDTRVNALPPAKRGVAMVFQSYALYPHMTVEENIGFGLHLAKEETGTIRDKVRAVAETLELGDLLDRLPRQLSGGQRQRVAIGRAIVREPRVFLFDEPLSNLDAGLRTQMRGEIAALHNRLQDVTMIYVTHDQVEAMTLADRIVVLRDGRVEQVGAPLDLYDRPATRFVAGFIGAPSMNFLRAGVSAGPGGLVAELGAAGAVTLGSGLAGGLDPAAATEIGIRPEHVVADADAPLRARVQRVENLGEGHLLHLVLADGQALILRGSGAAGQGRGDEIGLHLPGDRCHVFDGSGRTLPRA